MITSGLKIIREALNGPEPEPEDDDKSLDLIESGLLSIQESLYGPEPSDDNGNFTEAAFKEAASGLASFFYEDNGFFESGLASINQSLGKSSYGIYESKDECISYLSESLQILVEASKEGASAEDKIKVIRDKIDELDKRPNAPKLLVGIYTALAWTCIAADFYMVYKNIFKVYNNIYGPAVISVYNKAGGGVIGMASSALTMFGLTSVFGWIQRKFIGVSTSLLNRITTYIFNKITHNNYTAPYEKQNAYNEMLNTIEKMIKKAKELKQDDNVKKFTEIRDDLKARIKKIATSRSLADRFA